MSSCQALLTHSPNNTSFSKFLQLIGWIYEARQSFNSIISIYYCSNESPLTPIDTLPQRKCQANLLPFQEDCLKDHKMGEICDIYQMLFYLCRHEVILLKKCANMLFKKQVANPFHQIFSDNQTFCLVNKTLWIQFEHNPDNVNIHSH